MDDLELIQAFVRGILQDQAVLLSNPSLKAESVFNTVQLSARPEGLIATTERSGDLRSILVKQSSPYWDLLHQTLIAESFFPIGEVNQDGFWRYRACQAPAGYQLHSTTGMELWRVWWSINKGRRSQVLPMDLLILRRGTWYPIRDIITSFGTLYLKTLGEEVAIHGSDILIWLKKAEAEGPFASKVPA